VGHHRARRVEHDRIAHGTLAAAEHRTHLCGIGFRVAANKL